MKTLTLPGSKSITNRNLILAALAEGTTTLKGILYSDDTKYMMQALIQLGIKITEPQHSPLSVVEGDRGWGEKIIIEGGTKHIKWNNKTLFLGNSWTSVRFLSWLSCLNTEWNITITGNEAMQTRPIQDLADGIAQLWLKVQTTNNCPPVIISPNSTIFNNVEQCSTISIPGSKSSQYFTSLLQIAPLLPNGLHLEVEGDLVSKPYIDITINEMKKFWVSVTNNDYTSFDITPQQYIPQTLDVEGDASALSYIVAHYCLHGGDITITNIGNDTKQGDYHFLDQCKIFWLTYTSNGTSTTISAPGLADIDHWLLTTDHWPFDFEPMPDVSMTFMILSCFFPGKTTITWLQTLNIKECKRLDVMHDELSKLGIEITSTEESITIGEIGHFWDLRSGDVIDIETYDDHRIAMCFGVLNAYIGGLIILNPDCVNKTYPNFWKDLQLLFQS